VPRNWTAKVRRVVACYLLVLLQVHLLGVAMLHWHGGKIAPSHAPRVSASNAQPTPESDSNLLCTACLIVHNGAVQPASAAQVLPTSASVALIRRIAPNHYRAESPAMSFGRAPPLV
jgi:hypothetical protein